MGKLLWGLFSFCLLLPYFAFAQSEPNAPLIVGSDGVIDNRKALVIGNSKYLHSVPLPNTANDATAIGQTLAALGFTVSMGIDLSDSSMREKLQAFSRSLRPGDVSVFYYAGHGLQIDGLNYLIPVDAALERPADVKLQGHRLEDVIEAISAAENTAIVLLDACRDNPFATALNSGPITRGITVSAGLAPIEAGKGVYIGFATQPGSAAYDGGGKNSPFAEALLRHMATPTVDIEVMMRRVRADVMASTDNQQIPWSNSSLVEPGFSFLPTADQKQTDLPNAHAADLEYWKSIAASDDPKLLKGYLTTFPKGLFSALAEDRLSKIEAKTKQAEKMRSTAAKKPAGSRKTVVGNRKQTSKTRSAAAAARTQKPAATAPARRTEPPRNFKGRCRDGDIEMCRLNCKDGRRRACRMLQRLGG